MTEEKSSKESWRQVGHELETLGESLANTFRAAWAKAEGSAGVEEMQSGLEAMVDKVGRAINDVGPSAQEAGVRQKLEETAEALHSAGSQTFEEVRPQVVSALEQVNAELQNLIKNLRGSVESAPPEDPAE